MGNNPVNGTDPDGAYSWFGAWWRSGFSFGHLIHDEETGEWGYNTNVLDGSVNFTSHFGDEKIWRPENAQRILDGAWANTGLAGQISTYDRIMARGGDGIEFDPLGQLAVVQPLVGGARALLSGTARVGQGLLFGTSNRVFWSGGIGSAGEAAGSYAAANGAITLEMTFAGRTLTGLTNMTSYSFTKPFWNLASRGFANGARGSAEVFINPVNITSRSIWLTTERGVLRANGIPYNYNIISH